MNRNFMNIGFNAVVRNYINIVRKIYSDMGGQFPEHNNNDWSYSIGYYSVDIKKRTINKYFNSITKSKSYNDLRPYISKYLSKSEYDKIKELNRMSREVRDTINQTLQVANRRIQNIENAKIASPAYLALKNELGGFESWNRYSKFSIGNLDLLDPADVTKAVNTYSRALAYINNKTSTATGAREFVKNLAIENNIPFDVANDLITTIMEPRITNGAIVVNNFDSERVRGMVSEYAKAYDEFNKDYDTYKNDIKARLQEMLQEIDETLDIWD